MHKYDVWAVNVLHVKSQDNIICPASLAFYVFPMYEKFRKLYNIFHMIV